MSNILVQNIKHTNNTTAQTIDSTGRILTPARPAFRAYKNASGYVELTHAEYQILTLNATDFNVGSCYDTSTYRFTAPVTGTYFFKGHIYSHENGGSRNFRIGKGTANPHTDDALAIAETYFEHSDTYSIETQCVVNLTANDQVGAYIYCSSDTTQSYYSNGTSKWTGFEGYLLG